MSDDTPNRHDRLLDLLADRALGDLSDADRAELGALAARGAPDAEYEALVAAVVLAGDDAREGELPAGLRGRLERQGVGLVSGATPAKEGARRGVPGWVPIAACIAAFGVAVGVLGVLLGERTRALEASTTELVALRERIEANRDLLEEARVRTDRMTGELALAAQRETALAARLAAATEDLDSARLAIARYEQPADPEELRANRRRLQDVPGTVRVAWAPFDLPDAPAEQRGVEGDVIWNDELQQGYLRFVGLEVNDPSVEQYQVWVIDERGLEQKVSGGVFNATASGEVIVPIEPGIDVGRVVLFAITVEDPGGTWVPDLSRRVVVGQRGDG